MNLPKDRAEEILELCLSNESPKLRTKVYEILNTSGIKPNDPMFLVLALTGQMRVFLEAAPEQLDNLLSAWKLQSETSINDLSIAIAQVKEIQLVHLENIKQTINYINYENVENIRNSNKMLLDEILVANRGAEKQIKKTILELTKINSEIKADREVNINIMKSLIEGIGKTNEDLINLNYQIQQSINTWNKIKFKIVNNLLFPSLFIFLILLIIIVVINFALSRR
ncbi:hypothetical protein NIES4102_41210 (plasmid) [Chondrocystis sp. NIES-4102]|nr:hypothetical protein NIES4102_41210 [Chondrocystis sp. NIES-4102]